jgi:DNA polymerase-3 subunit gamma/tau
MTEYLSMIAQKEQITFEPDALHVIAEKADGAMRDALSIFDQLVAFCGKNLTYNAVIENLNVLDHEYYFKLTQLSFEENIPECLLLLNNIMNKGFDAHHFVVGWGAHLRRLMVCKDPATIALLEVSENVAAKYQEQSTMLDIRFLIAAMDLINECDIHYRGSKHQRLLVELTIMKICSIQSNRREGEKKK